MLHRDLAARRVRQHFVAPSLGYFFFYYGESELTFENGNHFIYLIFLSETNLKPRKAPVQTGHLSLKSLSELKGTLQCEVLLLLLLLSLFSPSFEPLLLVLMVKCGRA